MALDDYKKTLWAPTMPITEDRMNKLEEGVEVNRNALKSLDSTVTNHGSILDTIGTNTVGEYSNKTLWGAIASLYLATNIEGQTERINQGVEAYSQILDAVGGKDELGNLKQSLAKTLELMSSKESKDVGDIYSVLGTKMGDKGPVQAYNEIDTVYKDVVNVRNILGKNAAETGPYFNDTTNTVAILMRDLIGRTNNLETQINEDAIAGTTYENLAARINGMNNILNAAAGEGGSIALLRNELDTAHTSSVVLVEKDGAYVNKVYNNLDERLEDIESRAEVINTTLGSKINTAAIRNSLGVTEENTVLDGRVGKTIRDMLYNTSNEVPFTADSTVAKRITDAETNAKNYANSILGEGFSDENTVAKVTADLNERVIDVEAELSTAHTSSVITELVEDEETHEVSEVNKEYDSIDSRFESIEAHKKAIADELNAAHVSSVVRTEVQPEEEDGEVTYTDTTYDTLNERLEAIETHAAASKEDIDVINDKLNAARTSSVMRTEVQPEEEDGEITYTDTTYDTLDERLEAIESYAVASKNNIDTITAEINGAHRTGLVDENNESINDSLDKRFDDIEAKISHPAENEDAGGLTERLTSLEGEVRHASTGLAATKAIADANATAISHTVGANGQDDKGGLVERVTILEREPKSATEVVTTLPQTGDETKDYLVGPNNDGKYFYYKWINNDWHLISGGGSGSGNTSGVNLTAAEYATLKEQQAYAENTDYYVLEDDGIRHHYRYIATTVNGETALSEIEIGLVVDTNQIKKYNINRVTGKKREYDSQTQTWTETDEEVEYLNLYQYNYDEDNSIIDTDRPYFAQIELPKGGDGGSSSSSQKNTLTRIGSEVVQKVTGSQILLRVFFLSYDATGTESSVGYATLRTGNTVIFSNRELSSYESSTVPSPLTWQENTAGFHEFDVTDYCGAGNTIFTLSVNVGGAAPLGKTWRVNLTELRLESDAPDNLLIAVDDEYAFPYTPIGAVSKNLIVTIDKGTVNEQTRTVTIPNNVSGTPSTYIFGDDLNLTHGKHTIEMQLSALIGGVTEYSNKINREYIWYDANDTATPIIIASQYEGTTIEKTQYATIEIPYQVYKKDASIINVEYYLDGSETPYQTSTLTNTNTGILTYIASDMGNHSLQIKVDDVAITINLKITKSDKDLSPISGMVIDFDPTTLSNSATNRLPQWNARINQTNYTYKLTASPNFNWSDDPNGGGYKKDGNGDRCFVIKAGSYVDLDYPMFAHDVFGNGAEMKITFKTSAVRNAEAIWYKNVGEISGKTVGIQLSTHSGWLKTDKAVATTTSADEDEDEGTITVKGITYTYWQPNTAYNINDVRVIRNVIYRCINAEDTSVDYDLQDKSIDLDSKPYKNYMKKWTKIGQLDTEIIATNSYLYFPYSEEDKIELDININKSNSGSDFIMSYEDGVPSKAYAYTTGASGDKITHNGTIRIGSNECDVYIYHLRYYVKSLSTDQILQNFIADGKDLNEKVERYDRNCIYWNPYINDGNGGYTLTKTSQSYLDPIKLAEKMPDVKVLMLDTDVFTTSKKDFVMNSTLRCIHAAGGNIYKSRGDEDNWLFINGFHAGQGTTSDNYGQSARNVDFLFEVDGRHWPSKEGNMGNYSMTSSPNYISAVIKGEEASEFANNSWSAPQNEWMANTDYIIGDKVVVSQGNNGTVYACEKAHTSDETFDAKNWNQIGTISKCTDWMEDNCKITLTESSVPNNYFNFKANVASSENVNNALFQKRYDDFLTYSSPAQRNQTEKHRDTYENIDKVKVKNCMEFVPAVLFVRERAVDENGNPEGHVEFNDTNWHFYALGNIGDSKKTDYTRAYDPDDMNEFTCENSDNNTNNGQFQSGVFMYDDHEAIETDYSAWSDTAEYKTRDIVVYNGMIYTCNTTATVGTWIPAEWSVISYTGWTDDKLPYFAPRTNPNPMDYIYPISPSQWNVKFGTEYLNRKHMTLLTEEFDGDHSFEFRYACCGDYRDGDRINDTHGDSDVPIDSTDLTKGYKTKDDVQEELNHDVVLAFYEWLITSNLEQYRTEAPQWFVKNAMEFFYAYTHYYTMMDNRAKNTFWHFAKTGNYIKVSRPVKELLHIYEVPDGNGGYQKTTDTELDPTNPYYTQYAFDLWVYDCDTAAGIDNNGALVFPYGKEDEDYRVDGQASSGYAFNGAGSIFWRRLKNVFKDEIASVMTQPSKNCFNPEHLINEFDSFQNCFPEEVWRLDIERKYIRTYTGQSIDGSITTNKQNARFLMSMMQGRKKYQRRQWIRDQSFYFNSKYKIGEIDVNRTEFSIVSPAGDHSLLPVTPDYHLHLTPYQDMYLNVVVGNGSPIPPIRAKANKEYVIKLDDYTAGNFQETRVYISGFRMISKLGGLASMYPYSFTLNGLDHLKELDIGTEESGYTNGNFTELPLTDQTSLPLLEKLNIKNCNSLSTSVGLKTANNLRIVEAAGSNISGISLPDYTQIEVLHLPMSVTDVILNNARFLRDFTITDMTGAENYSNLYTLNIINSDYSGTYTWKENTEYTVDEIIVIGNNVYKCKTAHTSVASSVQSDTIAWDNYLATNWTLIKANTKLPVDWLDIATKMLQTQSLQRDLKLLELSTATIANISTLEPLSALKSDLENAGKSLELSGTINITGEWSEVEKRKYQAVWKNLQFNTNAGNEKIKCAVNYYNTGYIGNDGEIPNQLITTIFVDSEGDNSIIPDIYADIDDSNLPKRDATIAYTYSFGSYDENDNYIPYSGWTLDPNPDFGDPIPLSSDYNIDDNPFQPPAGTSEISLYTFFYTIKHKYKVQWKVEDKVNNITKVIKETNTDQEYGGGYSLVAPTIMDIRAANIETNKITDNHDGTFTYEIIEGWEKLPINISPTKDEANSSIYVINAKWSEPETKTLAEFFEDTSELTAKQLAILSKLNQSTINSNDNIKKIIATRKFNYTMGYEGAQSGGTEFSVKRTSKTGSLSTFAVNPFAPHAQGQDKGFTLVIDYQFGEVNNGTSPEVLVGCYDKDASGSSICSFALYRGYNATNGGAGTFVCFGVTPYSDDATKRRAVGDAVHRNTIVLRREKNTSTLRIYTGLDASSTTSLNTALQDNIAIELGTLNTSENAVICIGALRADLSTNSLYSNENNNTKRALGTVYWMKYWDEDIGLGECLQLAAWPRENMTAIITAVNTATNRPKLYFTNLNCSNHSMVTNNTFTVPNANDPGPYSTGWLSSNTKAIYDTRVVRGLPVELQAVIKKPSIGYYNYVAQYSGGSTNVGLSDLRSIESYVYAPSVSSLDLSYIGTGQNEFGLESIFELTGSTDTNTSAITPYQWMRAPDGVINAQRYTGGGTNTPWATVTPEAYWFNIRFNEKPISWSTTNKMNVYIIDSSTIGSSTFYDAIGGTNIQSGDIVIYRTITSGETQLYGVYMYVTTAESSTLGLLTMPNEGYWSTSADGRTYGGWIESTPYITRSVSIGGGRQPNYAFVDKQGGLHFPTLTNDQAAAGSLSLDFAFTI